MTAALMDGTALACEIAADTARRARDVTLLRGRKPCLATVLVGDDPASRTYVRMKQNRCAEAGIDSQRHELAVDVGTAEVVRCVQALTHDPLVDGILVQHAMPAQVDERAVFEAIAPSKDVDGVTITSFAAMSFGESPFTKTSFASCTPAGILRLLDSYGVGLTGRHAVVVGRSAILGKPVGMLLLARDASVTFCHSKTEHLPTLIESADIVVAAVGRPGLIRGEWLRRGAVVIDAGYNAGNAGDVDFASASARAGLLTPVPGGVGPMTIAVLLAHTVDAAQRALA